MCWNLLWWTVMGPQRLLKCGICRLVKMRRSICCIRSVRWQWEIFLLEIPVGLPVRLHLSSRIYLMTPASLHLLAIDEYLSSLTLLSPFSTVILFSKQILYSSSVCLHNKNDTSVGSDDIVDLSGTRRWRGGSARVWWLKMLISSCCRIINSPFASLRSVLITPHSSFILLINHFLRSLADSGSTSSLCLLPFSLVVNVVITSISCCSLFCLSSRSDCDDGGDDGDGGIW